MRNKNRKLMEKRSRAQKIRNKINMTNTAPMSLQSTYSYEKY